MTPKTRSYKTSLSRTALSGTRPALPPRPWEAAVCAEWEELKMESVSRLLARLPNDCGLDDSRQSRRLLASAFQSVYSDLGLDLVEREQKRLFKEVLSEVIGYGPLEPLLADDQISEIMVNGPGSIWIETGGRMIETAVTFQDDDHVERIIDRILAPLQKRVDRKSPLVDARLPDGSRVNIVIPPSAVKGPAITIRKFHRTPLTPDDLIRSGTLTPPANRFLEACVASRLNVAVSGPTGSGKTTMLNALSSYIRPDERIVTVEDAAELKLNQRHVVSLETRPPGIDGSPGVTVRDLVINCMRMRPDRIVVGECRGKETLDMLQAMNTGHEGSLTTIHANSPRDALARLETMVLMAGMMLPHRAIREQIASALDLIIHMGRLADGVRKVTHITEVQSMEEDTIVLQDLFLWNRGDKRRRDTVVGEIVPTGMRPKFISRLEEAGFHLPPDIFGVQESSSESRPDS